MHAKERRWYDRVWIWMFPPFTSSRQNNGHNFVSIQQQSDQSTVGSWHCSEFGEYQYNITVANIANSILFRAPFFSSRLSRIDILCISDFWTPVSVSYAALQLLHLQSIPNPTIHLYRPTVALSTKLLLLLLSRDNHGFIRAHHVPHSKELDHTQNHGGGQGAIDRDGINRAIAV